MIPPSMSAAARMLAADLEPAALGMCRPIAPGNGPGSPPPWYLGRSGGLWAGLSRCSGLAVAYNARMSTPSQPGPERIIRWIMIGVVAWGVFHAIGAWRLNHDPRRMLVVLGCVAAFLGFWAAMLAARTRRLGGRS
jgi:hypothetical protein